METKTSKWFDNHPAIKHFVLFILYTFKFINDNTLGKL